MVRVSVALFAALLTFAVIVVLTGSNESQRFVLRAVNAGQLVEGNLVKVGGVRAGIVESIDLAPDNQAEIEIKVDDPSLLPLHRGTRAEIRLSSLSSVAGRYISLLPGRNDAAPLKSGATISAIDVSVPVEIDQLLSVLNAQTRVAFRSALRGSAALYRGQGPAANAALRALNPALSELAATVRELGRDDARLERFLVESASVVGVLADRDDAVDVGLSGAADTATALAARSGELEDGLERAPRTFGDASRTLTRLADVSGDIEGALRDARPVAPRLASLVNTLDRVLPRADPALEAVRELAPRTSAALRTLPALSRVVTPAFGSATKALADADPIIAGVRPYVPDVVHGLFSGFGGQTFNYYDANGHYGRVRPMVYAGSTQAAGALSSLLQVSVAGDAEQRSLLRRCPGSATVPAPDGSNPFKPPSLDCDLDQVP